MNGISGKPSNAIRTELTRMRRTSDPRTMLDNMRGICEVYENEVVEEFKK